MNWNKALMKLREMPEDGYNILFVSKLWDNIVAKGTRKKFLKHKSFKQNSALLIV